ncbi:MAG: glycoside hydrolase family 30 protein, partial [Armatimonadaceae bacterium]
MEMYLTTPDRKNLMTRKADIQWGDPQRGVAEITVDVSKRLQPFLGVGAALTNSSAFLLKKCMSDATRDETLRALFSPVPGAGFSVIRICMGASDFNHAGSYTYCDYPDPSLRMFSIHREQECLIPIIKDIIRINPHIRIIASPWSAPAWMKTNNSLNGGWLAQEHYDTYAGYFVRYIDAMRREGITIDYITPQNEPRHNDDRYPSMRMEPSDQARFIGKYLGPALRKANIRTKILCWDHNWDMIDFPMGVLADPDARKYTAGAAFHAYAGEPSAQAQVQKAFPEQEIHFTESSG